VALRWKADDRRLGRSESVIWKADGHVDRSVLLSFSCSGFVLLLFCLCIHSLSRRGPFVRSSSLGQGAVLN
jgi:hypothetical protein